MFSSRFPNDLSPNRLARAIADRRRAGGAIVDLTLSNPTRAGIEYPDDLLSPLADPRALVYDPSPFGSAAARAAVAGDFARRGLHVPPDRIVLTASTSEAYSLLFRLLADPGDDVLVPRPSYPLFEHLTSLDSLVARPYDLEYHGAWTIDVDSLESAIGERTRAILVVSPNNPTGSFLKAAELDRIAGICAPRRVAVIADEVFADYELEPGAAATAGRVLDRRDGLFFSLGGLSKSVGLPQVKLGWIAIAGEDAQVDAALERLELLCDTYLSVSTPAQIAAPTLLNRGAAVRRHIQDRVMANYGRLRAAVSRHPECDLWRAEGGWYSVLKAPAIRSEEEIVINLLDEEGILVHPGFFFDFHREAFLVLSLLPREADFAPAVERLLTHVVRGSAARG